MTLISALRRTATKSPSQGVHVLESGNLLESVAYEQLYQDAGAIGGYLVNAGVGVGERVAISMPNCADFVRAFFGILAAGAVAVPLPPPARFSSLEVHLKRLNVGLEQSRVRTIITNRTMVEVLNSGFASVNQAVSVICLDDVGDSCSTYIDVPDEYPAMVQYTSGTTTDPKGVILTHSNILANIEGMTQRLRTTAGDVVCSWLPLFHDMGLIGHTLLPAVSGMDLYLLRPEEFIRRPISWLKAISDYGAMLSTAPNSAYAHCVSRISEEEMQGLDLSSWSLALNGAEAIDASTIRQFSDKFKQVGFSATSLLPVYGLAEATLAVSFAPLGREAKTIWAKRSGLSAGSFVQGKKMDVKSRELVSVGTPVPGIEYQIVGPDSSAPAGIGDVGEIVIRGLSVSAGYENRLHDGLGPEEWLATGDLGVQVDGELYIVGRKKEMFIVFGQNYYASDIETIVAKISGVSSGGVLATTYSSYKGGEEELVILLESKELSAADKAEIEGEVRYALASSLGVTPRHVLFASKGSIERTSSGKLRRNTVDLAVLLD